MVAYGSPKPLIWVRILVPVQSPQTEFRLAVCSSQGIIGYSGGSLQKNDMNKLTTYIRDSYTELVEKVTWPGWEQLQQSTMIVLGATLFITALVAVMDYLANTAMKFIYTLFN